jgi:hypothetical protein
MEKRRSWFRNPGLGFGPRFCISNELPADAKVAGPWTSSKVMRSEASHFNGALSLTYLPEKVMWS